VDTWAGQVLLPVNDGRPRRRSLGTTAARYTDERGSDGDQSKTTHPPG
jgi:hypothetical protein